MRRPLLQLPTASVALSLVAAMALGGCGSPRPAVVAAPGSTPAPCGNLRIATEEMDVHKDFSLRRAFSKIGALHTVDGLGDELRICVLPCFGLDYMAVAIDGGADHLKTQIDPTR